MHRCGLALTSQQAAQLAAAARRAQQLFSAAEPNLEYPAATAGPTLASGPSPSTSPLKARAAIKALQRCLHLRREVLHEDNALIGRTLDALAQALRAAGRAVEAAAACEGSVRVLRRNWPPDSTHVAFQEVQSRCCCQMACCARLLCPLAIALHCRGA